MAFLPPEGDLTIGFAHAAYQLRDEFLTRGRADTRTLVVPNIAGFYRDAHKDHWGRLGLDATTPWGREAEFERKRIPGAETLDLADYLPDGVS